ncbi:MAG: transposase, partial [Syntrophales bacterium LBB04]|nr:transposase [Syntrophales bacterium LBB04]
GTGARVHTVWDALPSHYPQVRLDAFAIMPNHIHAIVALPPAPVGAQFIAPNSAIAVGEIVREFKARCTHTINQMRNTRGVSVWQRNYYEHIIRDEADYTRIAEYIYTNPQRWTSDTLHPDVRARFIAPNSAIAPNPGAPPFHDVRTPFIAPNAIAPDSDDGIKTGDMKKGNGVVNRGDQGAMNRAPTDGGCNE